MFSKNVAYVFTAFALWLIPSVGLIYKYFGIWGLFAPFPFFLLLYLSVRIFHHLVGPRVPKGWLWAMCAVMVCLFAILYPIAKSGILGAGSDRDDALNVALHSLLAGHYPYSVDTYLGNAPTPMLGALILALPFYLLGNSALQNLVWLPAFIFWIATIFKNRTVAVTYTVLFLLGCPSAMQDFVTGGDYLVNAIYVAIAMHAMILAQFSKKRWHLWGAELYLAIALSSRPIYVMAVPVLAGMIYNIVGSRRMIRCLLVVGAIGVLMNAPFYFYDPSRFPTAHLSNKLSDFPPWLHVTVILPALSWMTGLSSFILIRRSDMRGAFILLGVSLAVMFYPVLCFNFFVDPSAEYALSQTSYALPVTVFLGIWCASVLDLPYMRASLSNVPERARVNATTG